MPVLSLHSASFGYAGTPVIDDATFEVHEGEVIAVLGPNGSGKSTLMRGILGLNDHLGGDLELFGIPAASFRERTRIGYVPQRHTLSTSVRATVREIVEVGRLAHRRWWRRQSATDRRLVTEALARVGMADHENADVAALSGGQQRRVLIARALAGRPDILIMDEPTAGVDTASQEVLAEVLQRLATAGVTMVIVTHEIEALRGIVTRILEVSHGRITFDGTPADLATRHGDRILASATGAHHLEEDEDETARPYGAGPFDELDLRDKEHRHA